MRLEIGPVVDQLRIALQIALNIRMLLEKITEMSSVRVMLIPSHSGIRIGANGGWNSEIRGRGTDLGGSR
jgi:hypothetical protein